MSWTNGLVGLFSTAMMNMSKLKYMGLVSKRKYGPRCNRPLPCEGFTFWTKASYWALDPNESPSIVRCWAQKKGLQIKTDEGVLFL